MSDYFSNYMSWCLYSHDICSRDEVANLVHRLEEMTTESTTEHNNMNELVDYYIYLYYVLLG